MPSLFPLYFSVCMPVSASLYHYRLSLHPFRNLCEGISLCGVSFHFSFNFLHFLNLFPVSWILFQLSLLFQPGERLGELLIQCFISDKQCDHSQFTNLLHFKFLPCKRGQEPPFYLLPWASMRRIQWDGNSSASGCHCWDFLFIRHLISITSLSPRYPIWRVWIITFHYFTKGETETPLGHMAHPTL